MNEEKEIRFVDLFSGIGGFRLGLERASKISEYTELWNRGEEGRSQQCLKSSRISKGSTSYRFRHIWPNDIDKNTNQGYTARFGEEGADYSAYEQIANGDTSSRSSGVEEKREPQLPVSRFRCVWSNDFNKYANQIYTKQFGKENHHAGNIREINAEDIPPHDLLCGGFPCQSFSVAGKRKGFTDTRGTLFFEILRIAKHHRPRLLLLENVKGLLSAPLVDETGDTIPGTHGKVFETILKSLEELGYWWEYQVLNSKNYGVPQNRERVFIIGHSRNGSGRPIFPITKSIRLSDQENQGEQGSGTGIRGRISPTIDARYGALRNSGEPYIVADRSRHLNKKGRNLESPKPYANAITAVSKDNLLALRHVRTDRGKQARSDSQKSGVDNTPYGEGFREYVPSKEQVTGTVTTGINKDALIGVMELKIWGHPRNYQRKGVYSQNEIYRSLRTSQRPPPPNYPYPNDMKNIRRLTPTECERLQGFPDGWTEGVSDTQRYKCLGNAVTVNVIEFLGHRLRASIIKQNARAQ